MAAKKTKQKPIRTKSIGVFFTEWIGSTSSVIIHTLIFVVFLALIFFGFNAQTILAVLTNAVSLEAIYLAIFIQMTVNRNTQSLEEVEDDVAEIQEDIDEIQEDVESVEKDIDEIQKDVDEIQGDVDEIQEDVELVEKEVKADLTDRELLQQIALQVAELMKKTS